MKYFRVPAEGRVNWAELYGLSAPAVEIDNDPLEPSAKGKGAWEVHHEPLIPHSRKFCARRWNTKLEGYEYLRTENGRRRQFETQHAAQTAIDLAI